jgi:hypothetical protein
MGQCIGDYLRDRRTLLRSGRTGIAHAIRDALNNCVLFRSGLSDRKMVDERGFEPPGSSLRKQAGELDGVKLDDKE